MKSPRVVVRVPAKINLNLSVGPLRKDGYHDVATVYQAISLSDEVTAQFGQAGTGITISLSGDFISGVPVDERNLAYRAALLIAQEMRLSPDIALHILKSIPVAAGLAGGSADAAATLIAVEQLLGGSIGRTKLNEFAAELGSDVPFALAGGTAIGSGRGEALSPALARGDYHWVLVISHQGLSTQAVYAECDRLRQGREISAPRVTDALMHALRNGDAQALGKALMNDLQPAACSLRPALRLLLDVGEEYGALGSIVSGSGPTVAFLARDSDHALDLTVALSASGVAGQILRAVGPMPGARVTESR
ncbi:MAG TPA: 4-(cytidine 5'-diphospho)-2-C-methyl-D-erythritol kinase [Candidatus Nanopelagicaceae bacterium]|nr:4-(cytidine 5'-diphospho)-2-C-methyl-D-erythritol kinase [Candidatus Nanopelagicaceae bacterium]